MMLYPKSREEWLALRHKFIGSTESSALFGLSKYSTAYELAVQKRGEWVPDEDSEEDGRSQWGKALQFAISQQFAGHHGVKVRLMSAYADAGDGMGSSFDYEIVGGAGTSEIVALYHQYGPGVLEVKNVDALIYRNEWTKEEAPAHIEIQVQHQLEACDRKWAVLAVLIGGNRLEVMIRMRDEEAGAAIRQKIKGFWSDLAKGIMPAVLLPEDARIIAQVYKHAEPGSVLNASTDVDVLHWCEDYRLAGEAERVAREAKESAKAKLLQHIGPVERVVAADYTISCRVVGETTVEAYTRKAYRNFRVTWKKKGNGNDKTN